MSRGESGWARARERARRNAPGVVWPPPELWIDPATPSHYAVWWRDAWWQVGATPDAWCARRRRAAPTAGRRCHPDAEARLLRFFGVPDAR
jgi:hypothetical protein